jgi:hypothetical protein
MRALDIFLTVLIFLMFIGIYMFNTLSVGMDNIKKNWPKYRCNPSIMPFASYFGHEPVSNFTYCIQNMQTSYMVYLLEPTHYVVSILENTLSQLLTDINWIRVKISSLTSNITNIFSSIFGVFINVIIEFQKTIIKLKDVFSKVLGVMASLIYIMDGGMQTGTSAMAGPIGGALRFVCFHPDTSIKLENGQTKKISNIDLGDVLTGGSKVLVTLKIKANEYMNDNNNNNNNENNDNNNNGGNYDDINLNNNLKQQYEEDNGFYRIYSNDMSNYIYVTGSHLIQHPHTREFIKVKYYENAERDYSIKSNYLSCLVTSDHRIRIGEYTFWDWDD